MKIKHLEIENFRAISHLDEDLGRYTSFIGYNGGGKSSILHAIRWFFEDFDLEPTDVFSQENRPNDSEVLPHVKVTLTFDELTDLDRDNLGPYGLGEEVVLSRIGKVGSESKLYGERLICPAFKKIRSESSVVQQRAAAIELINSDERFSELNITKKTPKQDLADILSIWESDPGNREHLEVITSEDANHYYGAVGSEKLRIDCGFVFIPAAPDLTGQFDVLDKGSALQLLLGDILKGAVSESIDHWTEQNRTVLDELEKAVTNAAAEQLEERARQVNRHLANYLPGVEIDFEVGLQDWVPKAAPNANSFMRRGQRDFLIEREGHGVQRATLLALLQATADSRAALKIKRSKDYDRNQANREEHTGSLIVIVEEPEVYQHPVQARMLARSFVNGAHDGNVQFVIATHSPYFLDPNEIQSTFRVEASPNGSRINRPKITGTVGKKYSNGELDKYFLETVIESLFSKAALIVEGDTERAIFDSLPCDENGLTLREMGVSIAVAGGANSLLDMAQLIGSFGVPTFVVRDGDSDPTIALENAKNKSPKEIRKIFGCEIDLNNSSHLEIINKKKLETLNSWKKGVDTFVKSALDTDYAPELASFEWGKGSYVGRKAAILRHDLETELYNWPSFVESSKDWNMPDDFRSFKKAGVFARVAANAKSEDMPDVFKQILRSLSLLTG